jgi:membrane protease YdiL (CAAX protease family)
MDIWKTVVFLAVLWGMGAVISIKKGRDPASGTFFSYQSWGVWSGVLAATFLELIAVFVLWSPWSFRNQPVVVVFYMFAEVTLFTAILLFYRLAINQPYAVLGLSTERLGIRLIFGLRWAAGCFMAGYAIFYLFLEFQSLQSSNEWLLRLSRQTGMVSVVLNFFEKIWGSGSLWMPVLFLVILKPLVEEVIFRGLLYGPIRKKTDPVIAALTTSFLFMLADGSYKGHHLISGVLLAYLYERTGSLLPGILFHGLINLGGVLYFFDKRKINTLDILTRKEEAGWIALILLAAFLLIELVYRVMLRKGYTWKVPASAP